VGDFNIPLSAMETENMQRNNKTNTHYESKNITDNCRTFHTKTKEYTFFSAPQRTFSIIDPILDDKQVPQIKED
jgi:exonuclease III